MHACMPMHVYLCMFYKNCIWSEDESPQKWEKHIIVLIYRTMIKLNIVIIEEYHFYQLHTKYYPVFFSIHRQ